MLHLLFSDLPLKKCPTSAKQKRDRGRDSQPRPRPRLTSQPQRATKFGPEVSPACPRECPRKRGGGVQGSVPRARRAPVSGVSKTRPESVPGVSKRCSGRSRGDTPGTLFLTLRGPKGPVGHPVGHSLEHSPFLGRLSGTLRRRFGPEGPERLL